MFLIKLWPAIPSNSSTAGGGGSCWTIRPASFSDWVVQYFTTSFLSTTCFGHFLAEGINVPYLWCYYKITTADPLERTIESQPSARHIVAEWKAQLIAGHCCPAVPRQVNLFLLSSLKRICGSVATQSQRGRGEDQQVGVGDCKCKVPYSQLHGFSRGQG